jgi:hypothetical protein
MQMMCTGYSRRILAVNLDEEYFCSASPRLLDCVELDRFFIEKIGDDQDDLRRARPLVITRRRTSPWFLTPQRSCV